MVKKEKEKRKVEDRYPKLNFLKFEYLIAKVMKNQKL
jgi:hypothetical protein